jgi:predicted PurR-regulated permease PerM
MLHSWNVKDVINEPNIIIQHSLDVIPWFKDYRNVILWYNLRSSKPNASETLFLFVQAASSSLSLQKGIITNPLIPILSSLFFSYSRAAFMLLNKHHFVSYMIAAPKVKNNHNINCILQAQTCNFLKNYSTCQLCGVINSPVETIRVLRCALLV